MPLNVVLCRPPYDAYIRIPPLGLGYLSTQLKKHGYNSHIVDPLQKDGLSMEKTVERIKGFNPKLVGVHTTTDFISATKELVSRVRKEIPEAIIFVGGPHPTAIPKETLTELRVDFVVVGEGEETTLEIVQKLEKGKNNFETVKGVCFKNKEGKIVQTPRRPLIADLDSLPFPDWEEINPNLYPDAPHGVYTKSYPIGLILTSRGCPFRCTFCGSNVIWQYKFRQRTPKNIVDEIELLIKKYGCKEIHFEDDNFTLIKKNAMEVCDEIIRRGLKFDWKCPNGVRIDSLDDELLSKMKASGCYLLGLGVESGNQEILNRAKKNLNLFIVKDKLKSIRKHGIIAHGFFMMGLPGETHKTAMQTIRFARTAGFHTVQFNILCPLPGSEIYDEWIKGKKVDKIDWNQFNVHTGMYETEELSGKDLRKLQKKALLYYYSHPKNFFNFVKHLRLKQSKHFLNLLKNYLLSPEKKKEGKK